MWTKEAARFAAADEVETKWAEENEETDVVGKDNEKEGAPVGRDNP